MESKIDLNSVAGFDQMRVTVYLRPLIYTNSKVVGDYYQHHEFPKYEGAYHSLHDAMGNVSRLLAKERRNDNVLY